MNSYMVRGDRLPGSQLTESFPHGQEVALLRCSKVSLVAGHPSLLLRFLLNILESHVFSLCCFGLISVCCVRLGETDSVNPPRAGSTGGCRRKWEVGRGPGIGGEFRVLSCEMNTC